MPELAPTPANAASLTPRELAQRVQLNVTQDHEHAITWGQFAVERARQEDIATYDPTLAGEILAKLALRTELAGYDETYTDATLLESFTALAGYSPAMKRERVATMIMTLRITTHRGIAYTDIPGGQLDFAAELEKSWHTLREQHNERDGWDPYATMLARHQADNAALTGNVGMARSVAKSGITYALQAKKEGRTTLKHIAFRAKHVWANTKSFLAAHKRGIQQ